MLEERSFPSFVFIEPKYFGLDHNDDHPPHNIFKAEKLIADVYNAIRSSPDLWASTLLVVVYDEHGGFYDHVEPPAAVPPDDNHQEWTFDQLGVRVPAILVSPWVDARVEKTIFDHASLLRYLQEKWKLGFLGRRTESANSIKAVLNQDKPRENTIPFIRVPYSNLVPERPDLERDDSSSHHEAQPAFAWYLAKGTDATIADIIEELASATHFWVKAKASLGRLMLRIGASLTKDLEHLKRIRVQKTTEAAMRHLRNARR